MYLSIFVFFTVVSFFYDIATLRCYTPIFDGFIWMIKIATLSSTAVTSAINEMRKYLVKLISTYKWLKDPTYALFLKSWGFKDVKYV